MDVSKILSGFPMRVSSSLSPRESGDVARDSRLWTEAVEYYAEHLITSPDDFAILVQLGNCSKEAGDLKIAHQSYERAIAIDGKNADVHVQMGHLLKITGRLEDALESYERAVLLDPEHRDAKHERDAVLSILQNQNFSLTEPERYVPTFSCLDELLEYLRKYPSQGQFFKRYFDDFIP